MESIEASVSPKDGHAPRRRASSGSSIEDKASLLSELFGRATGNLITDCSCAIDNKILLHGRMYLTEKYLCFYSNIFSAEKRVRIPLSCIEELAPEFTALVIPNAIRVKTNRGEFTLRSFWDRDNVLRMIEDARGEILRSIRSKSKSSSPITVPTTTSTSPINSIAILDNPGRPSYRHVDSDAIDDDDDDDDVEDFTDFVDVEEQDDVLSSMVDFIEKSSLKNHMLKESLPMNILDFLQLFVNDGAEFGYGKYHECIGDENVHETNWEGDFSSAIGGRRSISFFKIVNLPGLKATRGVKAQKIRRFGDWGFVVQSSTRLEDVPMSSCFTVEDTLIVKAVDKNTVRVEIQFEVKFDPSLNSFFRYTVESSTNPEMTKWMKAFFNDNLKAHAKHFDINIVTIDDVHSADTDLASVDRDNKIVDPGLEPSSIKAMFMSLAKAAGSLVKTALSQMGLNIAFVLAMSYQMHVVSTLTSNHVAPSAAIVDAISTAAGRLVYALSSSLSSFGFLLLRVDMNTIVFALLAFQIYSLRAEVSKLAGAVEQLKTQLAK